MGSGQESNIIYPHTNPAESTTSAMSDYVNSLPALYQAQLQYEPQIQGMNLDMLQQ